MEPVDAAAAHDDATELRRLLNEDPRLVLTMDREKAVPIACVAGSVEAVRLLLDRGDDINNRRGGNGYTPLQFACVLGDANIVALLLARGADAELVAPDGCRALYHAALCDDCSGSDHVAVIRLLIKDGRVSVDARGVMGGTALSAACSRGHTERARALLLEGGADHTITLEGEGGGTALDLAEDGSHQGCIQLLQWYEGELERAFMLSKARAAVDDAESVTKAPEKTGARTQAEAQRAREEAAPAYLRGRVERGEVMPDVEMVGRAGSEEGGEEEEEERRSMLEYVVRWMKEDLLVELMEGLRYRWQLSSTMRKEMEQQ